MVTTGDSWVTTVVDHGRELSLAGVITMRVPLHFRHESHDGDSSPGSSPGESGRWGQIVEKNMTNKMSFRHRWNLAYLADQRVPGPGKYIVSFVMMEYANEHCAGAFPSHKTVAKRLGIHPDTVKRAIRQAHSAGYLDIKPRFNDSNMYQGTMPLSHEDLAVIQAEDQMDEALEQILTEPQPAPLVLDVEDVARMYDVPVDMVTPEPVESVPSLPVYQPAFDGPDLEESHGDPLLNEWFEEQKRTRAAERPVVTTGTWGDLL